MDRLKDAKVIQKVNATALGFLLPIRFINFVFPISQSEKCNQRRHFIRLRQRGVFLTKTLFII
ncbi:hypothetical protein CHD54_21105 [Salmonella enterica]|nr:hypothetical protein CHD54_21105 [Salmonella enterica]